METDQDPKEIDLASDAEGLLDVQGAQLPLTPALSLARERGQLQNHADLKGLPPLPRGEGGGEGADASARNPSFDLNSILLPQKNAPSPQSVQRAAAGAALEAAVAPALPSAAVTEARTAAPAVAEALHAEASQSAPSGVAMHTYKGDIEQSVRGRGLSVSDMISVQGKRGVAGQNENQDQGQRSVASAASQAALLRVIIAIGLLLIAAGMIGAVLWLRGQMISPAASVTVPQSSFIRTDMTQIVTVPASYGANDTIRLFTQARDTTALSLGLVARIVPVREGTTTPMNAQALLSLMNPDTVAEFSRAAAPQFLFGIHSFQSNQAFLMFHTDSYAQAYAGMLSWERSIRADLSPLFDRVVAPTPPREVVSTTTPEPQIINTGFADRTVENHDARVLQDDQGNILLLWTFLDRNTLVITTNEYTLRELISRLASAPIVPTPGQ